MSLDDLKRKRHITSTSYFALYSDEHKIKLGEKKYGYQGELGII